MTEPKQTTNKASLAAYIMLSLIAIFYLPTVVPLQPNASASYVFGYNNRAGVILILVLVALSSVWTGGINLQFSFSKTSKPIPSNTLVWALLAVLFGCIAMYLLAGRFSGFMESAYELNHIWLLFQGKLPYINFEFAYGASFLYVPLFIQRIFPVTLDQAYYIFWILNWVTGTYLLYAAVNMVDYPSSSKRTIFLLLFWARYYAIVLMGANYTPLRYTIPIFFILVIQKLIGRIGLKWRLYFALLSLVFTLTLVLISPEIAIAFSFACICVLCLHKQNFNSIQFFSTLSGLILIFAIIFSAALKLHVLDNIIQFGSGGFNLPIAIAPFTLLYIFSLFICACFIFWCIKTRYLENNTVGIIAYSIPMIFSSLGVCDPGHVVWNGEGIFLVCMFYLSAHKNIWNYYKYSFATVFILLAGFSTLILSAPSFGQMLPMLFSYNTYSEANKTINYLANKYVDIFADDSHRDRWKAKLNNINNTAGNNVSLDYLYPSWHGAFLAPFGYKPNSIGTDHSTRIDYGYYDGMINAFTPAAINLKIEELETTPNKALLLPNNFDTNCKIDLNAERRFLSIVFAFPYLGRVTHPESINKPLCEYIYSHYYLVAHPTTNNFNYGLWILKPKSISNLSNY